MWYVIPWNESCRIYCMLLKTLPKLEEVILVIPDDASGDLELIIQFVSDYMHI